MKPKMIFTEPISILSDHVHTLDVINKIASSENRENPFCVFNVDDIVQKYRTWKILIPRVKPHYAVKCNDHPLVLKLLATLGTGFDCASKTELDKVLTIGVDPSRIIYAHTTKPPSHIRHAAKSKVNLMTFDNELELKKIKNLFPTAKTVIRIKHDAKTSYCKLGTKFGCDPYVEAERLLRIAYDLGINVVGVSFHVGSGCRDPIAFHGAIEDARYVFDIAKTIGYYFNLLDIGGGYPGDRDSALDDYAKVINTALQEFFPDPFVEIISEPGTYFVVSAFTLVCNIHSGKTTIDKDGLTKRFVYYINDGVFGSLSDIISYKVKRIPKPIKNYSNCELYLSTVWGPTCDSLDQIVEDILLPKMQLGDWMMFEDMGAYTLPLCTAFNGFDAPDVFTTISEENWAILKKTSLFLNIEFALNKEKDCAEDNKNNKSINNEQIPIIQLVE